MTSTERTIELRLTRADSFTRRLVGLIGKRLASPYEALLLESCNAVHTFFMTRAIDLVFLDSNYRICALRPGLSPWRWAVCLKAMSTVELPAGAIAQLGIKLEDQLLACGSVGHVIRSPGELS
jgi:uncharacterized membrane protein (UPF0127 family)